METIHGLSYIDKLTTENEDTPSMKMLPCGAKGVHNSLLQNKGTSLMRTFL